jgi:hypothetical protein
LLSTEPAAIGANECGAGRLAFAGRIAGAKKCLHCSATRAFDLIRDSAPKARTAATANADLQGA